MIAFRLRSFGDCGTTAALQGVTAEGRPDGADIARSTNTAGNLMFSRVPITAGQRLAFVLTGADCSVTLSDPNDTYAGGDALTQMSGEWEKHPGSPTS